MYALRTLPRRKAFWLSWLVGFVFFLGSMAWLIHLQEFGGPLAFVGWFALSAYLALYFALFGLIADQAYTRHPTPFTRHVLIPSAWVALEYVRSHLLSGFGWNLLAYSQTSWTPLIQMADITGAWGVSWVIVFVNGVLTESIHRATGQGAWGSRAGTRDKGQGTRDRKEPTNSEENLKQAISEWVAAVGLVLLVLCYGIWRLRSVPGGGIVRVAVVQGNIPQEQKWQEAYVAEILDRYARLTKEADQTATDLIVWPETSVPGLLGADETITQRMGELARGIQRPLLVGAAMLSSVTMDDGNFELTNSAALMDPSGSIVARYDKQRLVPFGEFIPAEKLFPWLRNILPPIGDFVAGHEATVFHSHAQTLSEGQGAWGEGRGETVVPTPPVSHPMPPFSVLICFEDVFPEIARRFVRDGARFLLVITNDAWFGHSAAAFQHAQASTFRAVELRVPVARAANTGWSGCIDAHGRWLDAVKDSKGDALFVAGTTTCELSLPVVKSLYLQWGDWFAWLCLFGCLIAVCYNVRFFHDC